MTSRQDKLNSLDLDMFLPQRISMLARLTQDILAQALGSCGLTVAHWRIFHCLTQRGAQDLTQIAAFTVLPQSTVSRSVARLGEQGLLSIERDPRNRRFLRVEVTAAGSQKLGNAIALVDKHWRETFPLDAHEEEVLLTEINGIIATLLERRANREAEHAK